MCFCVLFLFCFCLSYIKSCPSGYTYCVIEGDTCSQSGVIAFGNGTRYSYSVSSGSIQCTTQIFGDPLTGLQKECCYQIPTLESSYYSPIVGSLSCGDIVYSHVKDHSTTNYWRLIIKSTWDVNVNNCGSSPDTELYLYDNAGNSLMSGTGCDGNDCGSCSGSQNEQFTKTALSPGEYYIQFKPVFDSCCGFVCAGQCTNYGDYQISISCSGTYPTGIPTPVPTSATSPPTTYIPTENPSKTPTNNPSKNPSLSPSNIPTLNPSNIPTKAPSKNPSETPSNDPTLTPSIHETENDRQVTDAHAESTMQSTEYLDEYDNNDKRSSTVDVGVLIIIGGVMALIIIGFIVFICYKQKQHHNTVHVQKVKNVELENVSRVSSINDALNMDNRSDIQVVPLQHTMGSVSSINNDDNKSIQSDNIYVINGGLMTKGGDVDKVIMDNLMKNNDAELVNEIDNMQVASIEDNDNMMANHADIINAIDNNMTAGNDDGYVIQAHDITDKQSDLPHVIPVVLSDHGGVVADEMSESSDEQQTYNTVTEGV